jgi:4-hydroxy-2-oxoheptanedioate aldolase
VSYVNPLLERWNNGGAARGFWATVPSSVSVELIAANGPDFVCVDMQHGPIGLDSAVGMLQAIWAHGVTPLIRVPTNDPSAIMQALDAGALGVVVPLVSSPDEAAAAVAACRYPPRGIRSYGPLRASTVMRSREIADLEQVACIVMVETLEGLEHLDAIAATEGLTGIYAGPADLSLVLGLEPLFRQKNRGHEEVIERIRLACERTGIVSGITCVGDTEHARHRLEQGFRMVAVGNDSVLLRSGSAEVLDATGMA